MHTVILTTLPGQASEAMNATASSLERGGLWAVVTVLMGVCSALFWLREKDRESREVANGKSHDEFQKLQDGFQKELLRLIEAQTAVITRQALLTEKVEALIIRVISRLERKED